MPSGALDDDVLLAAHAFELGLDRVGMSLLTVPERSRMRSCSLE